MEGHGRPDSLARWTSKDIDHKRLKPELEGKRALVKIYSYEGAVWWVGHKRSTFRKLENLGVFVKLTSSWISLSDAWPLILNVTHEDTLSHSVTSIQVQQWPTLPTSRRRPPSRLNNDGSKWNCVCYEPPCYEFQKKWGPNSWKPLDVTTCVVGWHIFDLASDCSSY